MNINLVEIFDNQNSLDKKSREFLLKAIERNNKEGFDYLEFKQAMIRLEKMSLDEETAIKSAFATASTVGLTKSMLMKSADFYLAILKEEYNQFNSALEKQMEAKVHSKQKQKEQTEEKLKSITQKIADLQKEKIQLESKLQKMDEDTVKAKEKIEETNEKFQDTLKTITERIQQDIEQFNNHISS